MNRVLYGIVEERYVFGNEERLSYGVVAYANGDQDGRLCVVDSVRDLSGDKHRVEQAVELCNRLRLDPIHLHDIAEDLL